MTKIIVLVLFLVIGLALIKWWERRQAQQKTDNFDAIARQMGWIVEGDGRQALYNQLSHFKVFQRGSWQDIRSVLAGQHEGVDFRIISFRHGSMTGIPTEYVILLIEDGRRNLPALAFRHKKAGFRFKNGVTPPEFDTYPSLKQDYALQTERPDEIRAFLRANLLETLAMAVQNSHLLEVEMAVTQFLCYQHKKGEGEIKTATVQQLVQKGIQIYRQFVV